LLAGPRSPPKSREWWRRLHIQRWRDVHVKPRRRLLIEQSGDVSQCGGALTEPLDRERAEQLASLLKAVTDPVRLQLLSIIRARRAL
jgi:hypothetical protein